MKHLVVENFMDFIKGAEIHQSPKVNPVGYTLTGANPRDSGKFHLEERPEIGIDPNKDKLKEMEDMMSSIFSRIKTAEDIDVIFKAIRHLDYSLRT